jgi:hypothetical protein
MKTWKLAIAGLGDIAEHTYMAQMHRNPRVEVEKFSWRLLCQRNIASPR